MMVVGLAGCDWGRLRITVREEVEDGAFMVVGWLVGHRTPFTLRR
jgi:hypothetical protein